MKFIKKFENHQGYEAYIATDYPKPNVSYCVQENEVHYNAFVPPPLFCKLTLNNGDVVKIEGSGELTSAMISSYKSTVTSVEIGEACTSIGERAFQYCSSLTSVEIGEACTNIGNNAFNSCSSLTSVTIGNGVTNIDNNALEAYKAASGWSDYADRIQAIQ